MAGDWIAMQASLWDAPEVLKLSIAHLGAGKHTAERRAEAKCVVIGALFRLWSLFDSHSDDGTLDGYDAETIDATVGLSGFAFNLQHVGWLIIGEQSAKMPNFERWLGQSAKTRMKAAERKRKERSEKPPEQESCHDFVTPMSQKVVTGSDEHVTLESQKSVTREEKRREENTNTKGARASELVEKEDLNFLTRFPTVTVPKFIRDDPEWMKWLRKWFAHLLTKSRLEAKSMTDITVQNHIDELAGRQRDRCIEVISHSISKHAWSLYWDHKPPPPTITEAKTNLPPKKGSRAMESARRVVEAAERRAHEQPRLP